MAQQDLPTTTMQWTVDGDDGGDNLNYSEQPIPALADNQVLVKRESPSPQIDLMLFNICERPSVSALADAHLEHGQFTQRP
jgi:hypothetical protein